MKQKWNVKIFKEGGKRMKFDLARKYIVGFLALALTMSLFVMPISAAPSPIVNASEWSVSVEPDEALNPAEETATHTVTVYTRLDGTLADPAEGVAVAVGDGEVIITPSIAATRVSTGVFTVDIPYPGNPGIYDIFGFIDADQSGGISERDVISDPVTKEWAERVATYVTVEPEEAFNDIADGTHTITVTVKDQFGDPIEPESLEGTVSGFNDGETITFGVWDEETGSCTGSYKTGKPNPSLDEPPFLDVIIVTADGVTATATKVWGYTPIFGSVGLEPTPAYNFVGEEHELTVTFLDQYGYPIEVEEAVLDFTVSGANELEGTVEGEGVTELSFSYVGEWAGKDTITVSGTVNGQLYSELGTAEKFWAYEWDVSPKQEVNALGAVHKLTIYGAPGDEVEVAFSSAGIFDLHNLLILNIDAADFDVDPEGLYFPFPASIIGHLDITLGDDGTASIFVVSQSVGKFFMDVAFMGQTRDFWKRTPFVMKVSKAYAQLTGFDITSDNINPITQVAEWDVHTVYATALGEFPVKPATVIPPVEPPEGGYYELEGDTLWVKDAPVAGVYVDWEVAWDYCADGETVDVFADRILDEAYSNGTEGYSFHQDGDPETVEHWLAASSLTDGKGVARLTYSMEYWGKGEFSTCTYHFPCLVDHITVTGGYGIPALDSQYGTITETAEKEWRDYGFKVYKFFGDPNNPDNYIGGAKFFLRRLDLPGTPTYVPPMPDGHPWVTGGFTEAVEDLEGPGNAAFVDPEDPPGVVTTFSEGPEKGAAIWYHLPDGVYGLYEYSVPEPWAMQEGLLYEFTIDDEQPVYWCAEPDKIITIYIENEISPSQVFFYKITDCWLPLPDAVFQATRLDTDEVFGPFTSDEFGKVVLEDLTFDPVWGSWYMVEEIETPEGYFTVEPFFFYLDENGIWNNEFYDDVYGDEVWPLAEHPENHVVQHWVVDRSYGVPPEELTEITLNLMEGWNLVGVGVGVGDTVEELFGDDFLRAFRWDPTLPGPYGENGSYFVFGDQVPEPGKGFWVKMAAAGEVVIEGEAVESPVSFDLSQGWEMIANPFDEEIPWSNVTIDGMSMEDAYAAGIIGRAFSWNGSAYEIADFASGTLGVGQGFWLRVKADCTIEFTR